MEQGSESATPVHVPVLYAEAVQALALRPDGRYLDGTFGRGGHAQAVLERLGPEGRLLVMDKDPEAIAVARALSEADARVAVRQASFATLAEWDQAAAGLDGVLLDLGVSSPQLDEARRGFSFQQDGPLDMRMDPEAGESVADFLARADEKDIADVLWLYGEERQSRRIARAIVARRSGDPLVTTAQLADLVAATIGRREPGKHPATRTFQALRIHVNRELDDLRDGLDAALDRLRPNGRLAVISFHSLEDRIVKQFIAGHSRAPAGNRRLPQVDAFVPKLRAIGGAITATAEEVARNPRSRSAVLRVAEKLA
ncbi:16S rRNA (cytosine(1402)-N(4))-methyltransferase RsmH [Xanthomonadaceae bacterium JHOS43]|nr:16S rRNA (cytosine(1402)-N(4))-methyltransferase RsmH [Xanthomonadaceae bacterium JHOS43]MCX7563022.1 16S rRNA (cytosine(1402)-N(4))-methyltransferase RsmH [Xanthomonadaceae bacterium XH05]